jgi:hypothetical protein
MRTTPTDLAHLLLAEYIGSYGNDWFMVPLRLPVGSLTRIDSLVVQDSFGDRRLLKPIGDRTLAPAHWSMWTLSFIRRPGETTGAGSESNLFYLPPTLGWTLEGPTLENVWFLRDEVANVAWAVEQTLETAVETPSGRGVLPLDGLGDAGDAPAADLDVIDVGRDGTPSRYLLATDAPPGWIPLIPVEVQVPGGGVAELLQRGALLQADGSNRRQESHSRVLAGPEVLLHPEEVPREGVRVSRNRRMARWIDGTTQLWAAQRVRVGRGEASSGLRFDSLRPGVEEDGPPS